MHAVQNSGGFEMAETTLESEGKAVIPKPVRDHLKLQPGDRLNFIIQDNGAVLVRSVGVDVAELKGLLYRQTQKTVSIDEMNRVIRKRAGEKL